MRSAINSGGAAGPAALPDARLSKAGFAEEALPCLDAVYRFALRLVRGNESEAADVVQETFLRAYRGWHTYERGTRIHSWLFTICRNLVRRQKLQEGTAPNTRWRSSGWKTMNRWPCWRAGPHQVHGRKRRRSSTA